MINSYREEESKIQEYLSELGIKGRTLHDLTVVITEGGGLPRFQLFVIENDGCFRSGMQLAHMYMKSVKDEFQISEQSFVYGYEQANNMSEKIELLKKLFLSDVNHVVANKVEGIVEKGLTLDLLYSKVKEYSTTYNPLITVKMILLHIEEIKNAKINA